jgi:uncharacterized protein (TIGR02246 family)
MKRLIARFLLAADTRKMTPPSLNRIRRGYPLWAATLTIQALVISFALPTLAQQKEETGDSQMSAEGRSYDVSRQLDEKIKNYDEAINRNDAAAVASLFTDDAIFVNYGGSLCGREAIEKQYAEWFKQWHHNNHLDIKDSDSLRVVGTADNIALNGKWSETDQQGEASVQLNGYWSAIYVRVGDTWKIRWLTYNVAPFPATATTAQTK